MNIYDIVLTGAPNERWAKFFVRFKDINTLEVAKWNGTHLLGYFCQKYYNHYNINYQFKYNSMFPNKSFEVFQMKKIANMLSSNPQILKDYIDWVFVEQIFKAKKRITSISFLSREDILIEFKKKILLNNGKNNNISRATLLPNNYKAIFNDINMEVNSYGDLAFLFQMQTTQNIADAFEKLIQLGFDKEILNRII